MDGDVLTTLLGSDTINTLTVGLGAAWASGINLYATVLVLGLLDVFGVITLPPGMALLTSPLVLIAAGVFYFIEFFADKIPGLDSIWDGLHTFIRIPAGALMAYGAMGGLDGGEALGGLFADGEIGQDATAIMALIGGGTIAAGTHATKAASRAAINLSPEPFTNWTASLAEDAMVITGVWLAVAQPVVFLGLFVVFAALVIWLLPKLWRGIRGFFGRFSDPVGTVKGQQVVGIGAGPAGPAGPVLPSNSGPPKIPPRNPNDADF